MLTFRQYLLTEKATTHAVEVEYTNEFEVWWSSLRPEAQEDVASVVNLLAERGVTLGFPYTSNVVTSKHGAMRELRVQHDGRPLRIFYCLDPRRVAILLTGGDKTGYSRFYEVLVPKADSIYATHLREL